MRAILLVTNDASFENCTILFEIVKDVIVSPKLGHLSYEEADINLGALHAAFTQKDLLLDSLFGVFHLPDLFFIVNQVQGATEDSPY